MKSISTLKVNKFRNLSGVIIPAGKRITAIAGQNGTSKTSLLGMISHIFSYLPDKKMLNGSPFSSKYSEIFRFSFPRYDKPGEHSYSVAFEDSEIIEVVSSERVERGKIKNLRLKVGKAKTGLGKIKIPVAYLGMKRLYPFAQENRVTRDKKSLLTPDELIEYKKLHNEILLMDDDITSNRIKTRNKDYFAPESDKYDHKGISAGQDNIGQIITAILSFKRLKADLREKYPGGIILIDELDASLFPAAQMKLVEKLFKIAKELDLQIFFTTHSLEVLEEVAKRTQNGDGVVIYLHKASGKIIPDINPDLENIRRALKVLGPKQEEKNKKIYVYLEDEVARDFAENIIEKDLKKSIAFFPAKKFGESVLQKLADANLPDLKDALFLIDGDVATTTKKVLQLPGKVYPELVIFNHLQNLPESDSLWSDSDAGYSKQFCFRDCTDISDKNKVKLWYKNQKIYLGGQLKQIWKSWGDNNQQEVKKFNKILSEKLEKINTNKS